jgi:hypothetical protein
MDTKIAHNFQGKVGSYQSPQTSIRSANYNAGQHPINVPCGKLQTTGCQHSVTHPEIYTGNAYNNPTAQPSGPSNFDKVGTSGQDWRLGDSISTSYKTPVKQNWAAPFDNYDASRDTVAAYSGHAGHQYTMSVDRQILTDVGSDT